MKARRPTLSANTKSDSTPPERADLYALMAGEHAQLDKLLDKAASDGGAIDSEAYQDFRERLLKHIRIEERILLPMAERKRGEPI